MDAVNSKHVDQLEEPYSVFISVKHLIRKRAGLRINTFASRAEVSTSTLDNLEKGNHATDPTVSSVQMALDAALEEKKQPKLTSDELMTANARLNKASVTALKRATAGQSLAEIGTAASISSQNLVEWILAGKPAQRSYVEQLLALLD